MADRGRGAVEVGRARGERGDRGGSRDGERASVESRDGGITGNRRRAAGDGGRVE